MAQETTTIARPYAEAVFRLATEQDKLDLWSDMLEFLAVVMQDPAMKGLVSNPRLSGDQLTGLLLDIAGGRLVPEGENFVRVLGENDRFAIIPEIAELYETLKRESGGALSVEVASAYPLNAAQEQALAGALRARLGREVAISSHEDPDLKGGVRIRAGDLVIDGSVSGRLDQLAKELGI